nr:hypothetical protein [Micromonospora sp. DSM 115978]
MDLTVDGTAVTASGTLDWVPGPSPLPWFALAAVAGLAVAFAGTRRRWGSTLALATVTVVAADVLHAGLSAGAQAEDPVAGFFSGNVVELVVWLLALTAAGLLLRRSLAGLYLAASAGFVMALVGGLADV